MKDKDIIDTIVESTEKKRLPKRTPPYLRPKWEAPPGFRTEIASTPAYDTDRNTYGISDVVLHLILVGPEGALAFEVGTGWYLPETVIGNTWARRRTRYSAVYEADEVTEPHGHCVIWHKFTPVDVGRECYLSSTGWCRGDTGYLLGDEGVPILLVNGVEGVWLWLLDLYRETDWQAERFG